MTSTDDTSTRTNFKPRLISFNELRLYYGERRAYTQLKRDVKAGLFPPPREIGPNRRAWVVSELEAYYAALPVAASFKG